MEMDEAVDEPLGVLKVGDDAFGVYPGTSGRFIRSMMKIGQMILPEWWLSADFLLESLRKQLTRDWGPQ